MCPPLSVKACLDADRPLKAPHVARDLHDEVLFHGAHWVFVLPNAPEKVVKVFGPLSLDDDVLRPQAMLAGVLARGGLAPRRSRTRLLDYSGSNRARVFRN